MRKSRSNGQKRSSSNGSKASPQYRPGDYQYFQLYDSEDSDLDAEVDPDVRALLAGHAAALNFAAVSAAAKSRDQCCLWMRPCCANPKKEDIPPKNWSPRCRLVLIIGGFVLVAATIITGLVVGLGGREITVLGGQDGGRPTVLGEGDPIKAPPPSNTILGSYKRAAVAIDGEPCAQVGKDVLLRNGTAVDAAVAALFCNGIFVPESMGIGGGFFMTIYLRSEKRAVALDARERAPAKTEKDMYKDHHEDSSDGARSAAIPGEVKGYWEAKQRFGNPLVSWASLVQPAIHMCNKGVKVSAHMFKALHAAEKKILTDPGMRSVFVNPETNKVWREGDLYKCPKLAETLKKIAENGPDEFYSGSTGKALVGDVKAAGGILSMEDLNNYEIQWLPAINMSLSSGHILYSMPPPGSGVILAAILNIMQHFKLKNGSDDDLGMYHKMAEAFKWSYAERTKLGDPSDKDIESQVKELVGKLTSEKWGLATFAKINDTYTVNNASFYGAEYSVAVDGGTAHASFLAPNGDAVSVTSTVNQYFGSGFLSPSTGIILNDEMDDFSFPDMINDFKMPPSKANMAKPGKRPLSSMCPTVVTDAATGDVRMVVGAAGGTMITTATAQVVMRNLWLGQTIKQAIDARRIHHQLEPMRVEYEEGITKDIVEYLQSRGHELQRFSPGKSVVVGIVADSGENVVVTANSDFRKSGGVAGI